MTTDERRGRRRSIERALGVVVGMYRITGGPVDPPPSASPAPSKPLATASPSSTSPNGTDPDDLSDTDLQDIVAPLQRRS